MLNRKKINLIVIIIQILILIPISVLSIAGNRNLNKTTISLTQNDTSANTTSLQDFYQNITALDWDFSTYYGGTSEDYVNDLELDSNDNIIICGYTDSNNIPTLGAFQENHGGFFDAFVAKFDSSGQSLIFASYLGGYDFDAAVDITLDSNDNIY